MKAGDSPYPPFLSPEEQTPADTPLSRAVRDALRAPMARLRLELAELVEGSVKDLEGRTCEALVEAFNRSKTIVDIHARLDSLEQWRRDTERCPPPSEGADAE